MLWLLPLLWLLRDAQGIGRGDGSDSRLAIVRIPFPQVLFRGIPIGKEGHFVIVIIGIAGVVMAVAGGTAVVVTRRGDAVVCESTVQLRRLIQGIVFGIVLLLSLLLMWRRRRRR